MTDTVIRDPSCESDYDPTEIPEPQYFGIGNINQNPGTIRDLQQ